MSENQCVSYQYYGILSDILVHFLSITYMYLYHFVSYLPNRKIGNILSVTCQTLKPFTFCRLLVKPQSP